MTVRFQSRMVLTGFLHCKSGARIEQQGDSRPNPPDLYVLRDLSGTPYISGSNFKNLLRRQVESVLKDTLGPGFSCDSFNRDQACIRLGDPRNDGGIYLQELITRYGDNDQRLFEQIEEHTCIACKLFGSQLVESPMVAEDLKPSIWGGQFKMRRKQNPQDTATIEAREEKAVADKFMIRVVLNNCEEWQQGLFVMALSRAQNKLITLSTGRQAEQHVATIESLSVRYLDSARKLYECLAKHEATDGTEVTTEQLQQWISSLREHLKKAARHALAIA